MKDLTRPRGQPAEPPPPGAAVLLDPRKDDPLDYLHLDVLGTFHFLARPRRGSREYERARYTIDILKLNERDYLVAARRQAFDDYRARLTEYLKVRGTPEAPHRMRAMMRCGHPTVWIEMKRHSEAVAELKALFDAAPEARSWTVQPGNCD